jgi:hypothetical protein
VVSVEGRKVRLAGLVRDPDDATATVYAEGSSLFIIPRHDPHLPPRAVIPPLPLPLPRQPTTQPPPPPQAKF